jgi:hypothetical protein
MSVKSRLSVVARFPNTTVHSFDGRELLCSVKNTVYRIADLARPVMEPVCSIPWRGVEHLSHIRFFDRALKGSILQVLRRDGDYLISTGKRWWHFGASGVKPVPSFSDTRPMNRGLTAGRDGTIFVADYRNNPEREPVRIFRSRDLERFDVAWEFPKGAVRHIHALVRDPVHDERIWVLTGDFDHESHIMFSDDSFRSVQTFMSAGQLTRATDIQFRGNSVYWGMDSPLERSYFVCSTRDDPPRLRKICELPGPAYYTTMNQAGLMFFGTTVEPGPAVLDRLARIYVVDAQDNCSELLVARKDIFPQYGIFYFPQGILPENYLVFSQRAITPHEGCMTIARVD